MDLGNLPKVLSKYTQNNLLRAYWIILILILIIFLRLSIIQIKRVLAKLHLFSHLNLLFIFANTWVIQLRQFPKSAFNKSSVSKKFIEIQILTNLKTLSRDCGDLPDIHAGFCHHLGQTTSGQVLHTNLKLLKSRKMEKKLTQSSSPFKYESKQLTIL